MTNENILVMNEIDHKLNLYESSNQLTDTCNSALFSQSMKGLNSVDPMYPYNGEIQR